MHTPVKEVAEGSSCESSNIGNERKCLTLLVRFNSHFMIISQVKKLNSTKGSFDISKKSFLYTNYVRLQDSKVQTLKMPFNVSAQTRDLMQQSVSTNIQLGKLSQILKRNPKADARANEGDDESKGFESINVQNLIYNGNQPIFKGKHTPTLYSITHSNPILIISLSPI
jgi:hypothetical protein